MVNPSAGSAAGRATDTKVWRRRQKRGGTLMNGIRWIRTLHRLGDIGNNTCNLLRTSAMSNKKLIRPFMLRELSAQRRIRPSGSRGARSRSSGAVRNPGEEPEYGNRCANRIHALALLSSQTSGTPSRSSQESRCAKHFAHSTDSMPSPPYRRISAALATTSTSIPHTFCRRRSKQLTPRLQAEWRR